MVNKDYEQIVNVLENIKFKDFALYILLKDYREKLSKEIETIKPYDIQNMSKNEYIVYNEMLRTYNEISKLIDLLAYDVF